MLPNKVKEIIKSLSTVYKENEKNIIIRCPYCGDSKNPRHAHLYISKTDPPYPFHCFRAECNMSGTVIKFLSDFNLLGKLEKSTLQALHKNGDTSQKYKINYSILSNKIPTIKDTNNNSLLSKINYIKNRLGIDAVPEWLSDYLIVDFKPILNTKIKINSLVRKHLQKDYIGFLTYYKRKIICRRIDDRNQLLPRYYMINLDDEQDYFIVFPNKKTRLLDNNGIIVIGEGVFDIINGYIKLKENILTNQNILLIANSGSGYYASYKSAIKKFGLVDWKVYIFADNDVSNSTLYKLFRYEHIPVYIIRNALDKDLGAKHIKSTVCKLK